MNEQSFIEAKQAVKEEIRKGNLKKALDLFNQLCTDLEEYRMRKEVIALQSRLNTVDKEFSSGLITLEEQSSHRNRITHGILNLLDNFTLLDDAESLLTFEPLRRYREKIRKEVDFIRVLGGKPLPLKNLYVRIKVFEKSPSQRSVSRKELQELNKDIKGLERKAETKDGDQVANEFSKMVVLGKAGGGKTTYLKYLALQMLMEDSKIETKRLPVFVELKEIGDRQMDLMDYLVEVLEGFGLEDYKLFTERMLDRGGFLILLDGLDEVSDQGNPKQIIEDIKRSSKKYDQNQYVVSCRRAAYGHWFDTFNEVELADFNSEQIETFVRNWFFENPESGKECLQKLTQSIQLKELSSVPLLLALLCMTFEKNSGFPESRVALYEEAVEALLEEWDETRNIDRKGAEIYQQLPLYRKKDLFAHIAAPTFEAGQKLIPQPVLEKHIHRFFSNIPGFDLIRYPGSEVILQSIEAQHGLLVRRAKNIYSFSHLTFQEYFTAKYLVDHAAKGALKNLIDNYLYEDKWREVFLMAAGMLDDGDDFFLLMEERNNENIAEGLFRKFLLEISSFFQVGASDESMILSRIYAIFSFLSEASLLTILDSMRATKRARKQGDEQALKRVNTQRSQFQSSIDLSLDLANMFDPALTPIANIASTHFWAEIFQDGRDQKSLFMDAYESTIQKIKNYARERAANFGVNASQIKQFAQENKAEINTLIPFAMDYLYGNKRLLECLETDCAISPELRQRLLDEMFLVPGDLK